jgi:hypothetical protein
MKLPDLPLTVTDWAAVEPTLHPGETGTATWRSFHASALRVRMVEYSPRWAAIAILTSNNLGYMPAWGAALHGLLIRYERRAAAEQLLHYRNQREAGVPVPKLGLRRRRWAEAAYALGANPKAVWRVACARIRRVDDWPPLPG